MTNEFTERAKFYSESVVKQARRSVDNNEIDQQIHFLHSPPLMAMHIPRIIKLLAHTSLTFHYIKIMHHFHIQSRSFISINYLKGLCTS